MENNNTINAFSKSGMIGNGVNHRRPLPASIGLVEDVDAAVELTGLDVEVVDAVKYAHTSTYESIDLGGERACYKLAEPFQQLGSGIGPTTPYEQPSMLGELAKVVMAEQPGTRIVAGGWWGHKESKAFIQCKLPESRTSHHGRTIEDCILIATGWGGSSSLHIMGTNIIPECTNQFQSMFNGSRSIDTVRHSGNFDYKVLAAKKALVEHVAQFDAWDRALRDMMETPMELDGMVSAVLGARPPAHISNPDRLHGDLLNPAHISWGKRRDSIYREYGQDFNDDIKHTAFGCLMAVQGAEQHFYGGKTKPRTVNAQITRLCNNDAPNAKKAFAYINAQ